MDAGFLKKQEQKRFNQRFQRSHLHLPDTARQGLCGASAICHELLKLFKNRDCRCCCPAGGEENADFIFWLQKGKDYYIAFVDPKGTKISDYEYKVHGYVKLFTKNTSLRIFKYNDLDVRIGLALYTHNSTTFGERYREFWIDTIERVFGWLDL